MKEWCIVCDDLYALYFKSSSSVKTSHIKQFLLDNGINNFKIYSLSFHTKRTLHIKDFIENIEQLIVDELGG